MFHGNNVQITNRPRRVAGMAAKHIQRGPIATHPLLRAPRAAGARNICMMRGLHDANVDGYMTYM
jgi:hypothetical protein